MHPKPTAGFSMRMPGRTTLGLMAALALACPAAAFSQQAVQWWVSSEDLQRRISPQADLKFVPGQAPSKRVVRIGQDRHQEIVGIGASFEHSTCHNLDLLPAGVRERVIESLVHPENGIGMSLMRICIGTSDFAPGPFYTYADMPPGHTDPGLERFSIERDRESVLPVLRLALRLNPQLKFVASPWTPPPWMKSNQKYGGGSLLAQYYPQYAEYLVRFIEAYRDEGIPIHAITVQNEPEFGPEQYPSCRWTAGQQRDFIRDHLGPLLQRRQLDTRIWIFDHNFNNPGFPLEILRDPEAARYVDGSAWHLYEGKPSAMAKVQKRFPEKHLYFTEGSTYLSAGAVEIMNYFRYGSRSYNAWVTMIDHEGKPNVSGFHDCDPTAIVLNRDTLQVEYRFDYYMYGHFSKFVRPGAVRIGTQSRGKPPAHVLFENVDGSRVLVGANPSNKPQVLAVQGPEGHFLVTLDPKSVATFRW